MKNDEHKIIISINGNTLRINKKNIISQQFYTFIPIRKAKQNIM